jgi:membrane-bound lytic murein transglycosylase A
LRFEDGSTRRIGYVAKNGRPYRSIGAKLIADKELLREDVSMQTIRAWLGAKGTALLAHNESYVFFRFLTGAPLGALGRPVTPLRSIATDLSLFPKGGLAFVRLELPQPDGTMKPLSRFVFNQDTGGAIVGPGRADIFFGQGTFAEHVAGHLKSQGRLLFFVPKPLNAAKR